jgi:hypothetical protein
MVVRMLALTLALGVVGGCGGGCDDDCHAERAQAALGTDLDRTIAEVREIDDPVLRTAVIMAAVRQEQLTTTPQQAIALCEAAPNDATRSHCENRFLRPHLQSGALQR